MVRYGTFNATAHKDIQQCVLPSQFSAIPMCASNFVITVWGKPTNGSAGQVYTFLPTISIKLLYQPNYYLPRHIRTNAK